jgi:alkanesulfonate monooxygenase SsuD/methylene tetrahydromethanopterin reductase-like flavin-dependent oxidoreductase (luciferase family)
VALTAAATATTTLVVGTGIASMPQRDPIQTAKEAASLDLLSEGRFRFGVGVGWLREEIAELKAGWPSMMPSAEALADQLEELRDIAGRDVPVIHFHGGKPTAKEVEGYRHLGVEHVLVDLPTEPRDQTLRRLDELQAEFAQLG